MAIHLEQLGFDFDGVIADTAEAFVRLACEKHNYCSFTREDITSFELESCLDIPLSTIEEIFTEILTDSVATKLHPIDGAVESIEYFTQTSRITIITARSLANPVYDWLELFFSENAQKNIKVVATGDHDDKVRHIHQHGLKYFIDDRAETCRRLASEDIIPFVYTQPWNRKRHSLQTVDNWLEIRSLIHQQTE